MEFLAWLYAYTKDEEVFSYKGEDILKHFVMLSKSTYERNKEIAEKFGVVVTEVKAFPTNGGWMIIDKYTKHMLEKDLKESDVDPLCKKMNYIRK